MKGTDRKKKDGQEERDRGKIEEKEQENKGEGRKE